MPINLRTGLPGSGKTLLTIEDVEKLRIDSGREVYYHNIPELNLPWIKLEDATKWNDLPPNSIIVIDECQKVFRPRGNGSAVPPHVEGLETHRHKGLDFFLITQHPMLIDSNVRRLTSRHEHVVRVFGKEKSNLHRWDSVKEQCDKQRADSIKTSRDFPKSLYGIYKSAETHTIKKSVPARWYLLLAMPFIVVGLLTYAGITMWNASHNSVKPDEAKIDGNSDAGLLGVFKPEPYRREVADTPDWYQAQVPRIKEMPHTAPKYDELTKPVDAPYPAACVVFRGQCKCYTQQATLMIVDEAFCRQIVDKGFFKDWQNAPQNAHASTEAAYQPGDGV